MFLKNDSGDVHAVGTPEGSVEADSEGVFDVPQATGEALLKMGGWAAVGPEATAEGKAAAEAARLAEEAAAQEAADAAATPVPDAPVEPEVTPTPEPEAPVEPEPAKAKAPARKPAK